MQWSALTLVHGPYQRGISRQQPHHGGDVAAPGRFDDSLGWWPPSETVSKGKILSTHFHTDFTHHFPS
jgi:hypothetical protein